VNWRSYRYQTNNPTVNYLSTADLIADKAQNVTVRFGGGRSMNDRNHGSFGQGRMARPPHPGQPRAAL
jgi:hypothetical protein